MRIFTVVSACRLAVARFEGTNWTNWTNRLLEAGGKLRVDMQHTDSVRSAAAGTCA